MIAEPKISRKEIVEQKAAAMFREKGYSATSMRDLATGLGIEAASLYSHIKSKEELLYNICFPMGKALFESLDALPENLSPQEKLLKALTNHLQILTRNPDEALVFLHEYRHLSEPSRSEFLAMRKEYEQRFMLILRQGIRTGQFRKTDEKITTLMLLSAVNSTPMWIRKEAGVEAGKVAALLSDILINGLAAPDAPAKPKRKSPPKLKPKSKTKQK